jgi:hypothetical protein
MLYYLQNTENALFSFSSYVQIVDNDCVNVTGVSFEHFHGRDSDRF